MKFNSYGSAEHKKNLENYIDGMTDKEYKHYYDIGYIERENLFDAWKEARRVGSPFNVMVQCVFDREGANRDDDIDVVRSLSHHYRMFMQKIKVPTFLMWSRFSPLNSGVELVTMLMHVPEGDYERFKALAERWDDRDCTVRQVTYEKDIQVENGRTVSSIEILAKACSQETQRRLVGVYSEPSDCITRPMIFSSVKLEKARLIHGWQKRRAKLKAMQQQNSLPTLEDVIADILKSKGIA